MERMKIQKNILFPVIISLILFVIPFFWLKPGEMDLGGDSTRLYFYDPISYLLSSVLYVISPSSFGVENLNYVNFPFITLLIILKFIVSSPTILICAFYGFSLSMAFIFCYLIIKELIDAEKSWYAAVVGALLYVLSPALIDGWKHVLITYNQVFLNPLIFYLLLRYFKTSNIKYIFITILLTFIFSPNFSIGAAPPLFAFYPLSILFLILYTKLILKKKIMIKHLVLGFLLLIGIQAFHILPQISNIFLHGSDINSTIFSNEGKFDRGLRYFSAIAPNIKASINLLGLPQIKILSSFSNVFLAFPFVIVAAFFFNKKKTIILTLFFFLIILFFATANITNVWISFYKSLFAIPGFSMFRNYYGQWQYVYIFFYSILFGQALFIILNKLSLSSNKLRKTYAYVLTFSLILILVINAGPLIKGDVVNEILWQSNNVKAVLQIDPDYEKVLAFVHSLPADGRVLTLPLSDPGYQIIAGINGGAYMGPSTIAYLAGKKDFAGYDELIDYKDLILKLARDNQLKTLKRILGILNIKYIFYNADPLIYDEFPNYPYQHVRDFLPKDQESYKKLIKNLALKEIKNIKNKFFVFELPDDYYLPQMFVAKKSINFNKPIADIQSVLSLDEKNNRIALFNYGGISIDPKIKFDEFLVDIQDDSSFANLITSTSKPTFGFPFVSWSTTSLIYPFVILREEKDLASYKNLGQTYIDRSIFFAEKRIAELERWGEGVSVLGNVKSIENLDKSWQEPNALEAIFFQKYNFWEVSLLRYRRAIYALIDKIEKAGESDHFSIINKDRVRKAISVNRKIWYRTIQYDKKLSDAKKIYLLKLSVNMLDSIVNRLQFEMPPLDEVSYDLSKLEKGNYEIFIDKKSMQYYNKSKLQAVINDKELSFADLSQLGDWFKVQSSIVKEKAQNSLKLIIPEPINLVLKTKWQSVEDGNFAPNADSLTINNTAREKNGLLREISNWNSMSYYVISFDYITYGKGFKLLLFDKARGENHTVTNILEDEIRSSEWKTYKSLVASSDDAGSAFMQILKPVGNDLFNQIESQGQITKIDIKNLSIIQVPNPKIIFRKEVIANDQNKNVPSVTFARINPTKYELKVRNATDSYTLVLVEKFNEKWRLIDPTQDVGIARAFFSRFIANVGKKALDFLGDESSSIKNRQLTYFGGDVKENVGNDIFLNKKTFETWGKTEIAEYKHLPANGNANAWHIEPADLAYKRDYDLIIEMTNQKLFYGSLFVSISIAVLTFFLIAKSLKK